MIFILCFVCFFFFFSCQIKASEYQIGVEKVEGLVYGNKLKDVTIYGNSIGIEGEFSFDNGELVLDKIGEITLEILFIEKGTNEVKKINYNAIVEKRKISVFFTSPIYKQYDGNDKINLPEYSYEGIINNEVTVKGTLTGVLSATYVSEDIALTLSGVEIEGEKKDCYYLDLLQHSARIYPSTLEKAGNNATQIVLDKDIYVDIGYSLKVEELECGEAIDSKYTAFKGYKYLVYSHNNNLLEVDGNFQIKMKIEDKIAKKERLEVFELTKDGEYRKIEYKIEAGHIYALISNDSTLILATRDIEYHFIALFSFVLIFYLLFIIVYRLKHSRMLIYKKF